MAPDHGLNNGGSSIDFAHVKSAMQKRWPWIAGISLLLSLAAGIFSFVCFQESYQSSAKVLLNLSNKEAGSEINPYKNQEELLRSDLVLKRVAQRIQKEKIVLKYQKTTELAEKVFNAERIPDTGFIRLTAKANKPGLAQKLAQLYTQTYLDVVDELSEKSGQHEEKMPDRQTSQAEMALATLTQKIEAYQSSQDGARTTFESQNKARQLGSLDSQIKITQADLAQKLAEAARIRKQLKMGKSSLESVMQAVAKGQDTTLNALQDQLHHSQKDYNTKALVYAPTNPDMIQLQRKIDTLKSQVIDQRILTVGQVSYPASGQIKDSVRAGLVSRLALADAEASALRSRLETLRSQYAQTQKPFRQVASHSPQATHLSESQKKHEISLTHVQKKPVNSHTSAETKAHKNLIVVDPPNLPQKPIAPLRWQIILLAAVSGLVVSAAVIAGQAIITQRRLRPEFIERVLDLPVLGSIPWLSQEKWRYLRSRSRLEMASSETDPALIKAYQDLTLNLKVRRNALQKNAVVFSQILDEKGHAVILANLAFCLVQGGARVLLVDADLRHPGLHEAFNHALDYERGLPELINGVSELLHRKSDAQVQDVLKLVNETVTPSGLHPQLSYLNAGLIMDNTFEFLNAKSFDVLLNVLKTGYDWVLISAPPMLKYPDCAVLAGYVDGLLLLTDRETEESHVAMANQKIQRMGSTAYGVILRDFSGY